MLRYFTSTTMPKEQPKINPKKKTKHSKKKKQVAKKQQSKLFDFVQKKDDDTKVMPASETPATSSTKPATPFTVQQDGREHQPVITITKPSKGMPNVVLSSIEKIEVSALKNKTTKPSVVVAAASPTANNNPTTATINTSTRTPPITPTSSTTATTTTTTTTIATINNDNHFKKLPPPPKRELSAYEQARLQNISRNKKYMESIGLGAAKTAAAAVRTTKEITNSKYKRKRSASRSARHAPIPRRVSKRIRNMPVQYDPSSTTTCTTTTTTYSQVEEIKEEELPFDDSKVCTYDASSMQQHKETNDDQQSDDDLQLTVPPVNILPICLANSTTTSTTTTLSRLNEITNDFRDDSLKKIYSMSFSPDCALLAAVGHGGRASIFGASGQSAGNVLMSFKAHKGWVASTKFLNSYMLLTAANDAVVTIWDLRKVLLSGNNQRPRIVSTNTTLHNNGIFCADVKLEKLATASKDKTVSYCVIGKEEIKPLRWFENLHSGVIKHVQIRDANVLASTGNDCDVCVCDARQQEKNGLIKRISHVHSLSTNHVSWSPSNENVLMTASFGNTIKLWDLRRSNEPIHEMKGHSMLYDGQRGGIYHPLFVGNGQYIVTPGHKSSTLTIFNTLTGNIVSKGTISVGEVTSLASSDIMGSRMAACKRSQIVLLDPVWS